MGFPFGIETQYPLHGPPRACDSLKRMGFPFGIETPARRRGRALLQSLKRMGFPFGIETSCAWMRQQLWSRSEEDGLPVWD